jgi:pimeloyl-ACP methyl ester carboxylesterase
MADRVAVLVPGHGYTVRQPLLHYVWLAAQRRDAEVRPIEWSSPGIADVTESIAWVRQQVEPVLSDARALVVGKSMGSLAAGLVAERNLPAIWLTPLVTRPQVASAIAAASVPPLLIGGTADTSWNGDTARSLSPHVLEIPDADHFLHVPGAALASVQALAQVIATVESFLDKQIWPA